MKHTASNNHQSFSYRFFEKLWYGRGFWSLLALLLWPVSFIFQYLSELRRSKLESQQKALPVPVVVVGNISVGGTGKTPVVIALVHTLKQKGIEVGVVSRGYGRQTHTDKPVWVDTNTAISHSGDEAALIAQQCNCPVVVASDRVAAAEFLLAKIPNLQLIISDDGLQHYRLSRQMEIVVVDAKRGFGNGYCLPAGPLRESIKRLKSIDWCLLNNTGLDKDDPNVEESFQSIGYDISAPISIISLQALSWRRLGQVQQIIHPLSPLPWDMTKPVVAIAAIGHPQRFFQSLKQLGIEARNMIFNDHHIYSPDDFLNLRNQVVLMTAKDAIKCQPLVKADPDLLPNAWVLEVAPILPKELVQSVTNLLDITD